MTSQSSHVQPPMDQQQQQAARPSTSSGSRPAAAPAAGSASSSKPAEATNGRAQQQQQQHRGQHGHHRKGHPEQQQQQPAGAAAGAGSKPTGAPVSGIAGARAAAPAPDARAACSVCSKCTPGGPVLWPKYMPAPCWRCAGAGGSSQGRQARRCQGQRGQAQGGPRVLHLTCQNYIQPQQCFVWPPGPLWLLMRPGAGSVQRAATPQPSGSFCPPARGPDLNECSGPTGLSNANLRASCKSLLATFSLLCCGVRWRSGTLSTSCRGLAALLFHALQRDRAKRWCMLVSVSWVATRFCLAGAGALALVCTVTCFPLFCCRCNAQHVYQGASIASRTATLQERASIIRICDRASRNLEFLVQMHANTKMPSKFWDPPWHRVGRASLAASCTPRLHPRIQSLVAARVQLRVCSTACDLDTVHAPPSGWLSVM